MLTSIKCLQQSCNRDVTALERAELAFCEGADLLSL